MNNSFTLPNNNKKVSSIFNLSNYTLTNSEKNVLEKGLNFCPSVKDINKLSILEDTYKFCRKMRLKEHFYTDKETQQENNNPLRETCNDRCAMKHPYTNPYYQPPHNQSKSLETYLETIKNEIINLCNTEKFTQKNITEEERIALSNLSKNENIIIKKADKGGKTVILNKDDYIKKCLEQLNDQTFYKPLSENITAQISTQIKQEIGSLKSKK